MSPYSVLISGPELAKQLAGIDLCLSFIHITVFTAHTANNFRFMYSQKDKTSIDLEVLLGQPRVLYSPLHRSIIYF
jgi:hypothetical protein